MPSIYAEALMKETIVIYFMGMDGSGKSTLSSYLHDELKNKRYDVKRVWWLEGENSVQRKLLRMIGGSSLLRFDVSPDQAGISALREQRPLLTKIFTAVYPRLVLLDYTIFGIWRIWVPKMIAKERILIFDRYIYDVIYSLSQEFGYPPAKRVSLFRRYATLLPVPDKIFLIEVPPDMALSRKKEEMVSAENAKALWGHHQELFRLVDNVFPGRCIVIDNTRDVEIVKKEILEQVLSFVH
jgi:thymidylate kinase